MAQQDDWDLIQTERPSLFGSAGMGAVRIALLFGSAAVALALFLAPLAESYSRSAVARSTIEDLDFTATGSIRSNKTYTIRRSVLQTSPNSVCVIGSNGRQSGDC